MTAPVSPPATSRVSTVEMSVELSAGVAPWEPVVVLADVLDLHAGFVELEARTRESEALVEAMTLSSQDRTRLLTVSTAPDGVRLQLAVTAPERQAREVLAGALDTLAAWAEAAGVTGWRWTADGCAGWHCAGPSCLAPPPAPARPVSRWRRWLAFGITSLGVGCVELVSLVASAFMLGRAAGLKPSADTTVVAGWPYAAGAPAVGASATLAAYVVYRLLVVAAALVAPPARGRLAEVRDAVLPVALAVAGTLLGLGWLR